MESLEGITFSFKDYGTGNRAEKYLLIEGTGYLTAARGELGAIGLLEGTTGSGADAIAHRIFLDGETVFAQDNDKETVWTSPLYRFGALLMYFNRGEILAMLSSPETFRNLQEYGPKIEGSKEYDGTVCNIITLSFQGGREGYRAFIGKEDSIIRRMEHSFGENGADGTQIFELSNVHPKKIERAKLPARFFEETYPKKDFSMGSMAIGDTFPDWSLEIEDGKQISSESLRGKVVLLDFWATWCAPCRAAMQGLQTIHEEYADQEVRVIGLQVHDKKDPAPFLAELGITYPTYKGDQVVEIVGKAIKVQNLPALFVVSPEGKLVDYFLSYSGKSTDRKIRQAIEQSL